MCATFVICLLTLRTKVMGKTVSSHNKQIGILCSDYKPHQSDLDTLSAEMLCSVVCIIPDMQMYVKQRIIYQCVVVALNLRGQCVRTWISEVGTSMHFSV